MNASDKIITEVLSDPKVVCYHCDINKAMWGEDMCFVCFKPLVDCCFSDSLRARIIAAAIQKIQERKEDDN